MLERLNTDLNARIAARWNQCRRARQALTMLQFEVRGFDQGTEPVDEEVAQSLLSQLGKRLTRRVRDTDEVLVLGDGRFVLLLPGAGPAEAEIVRVRLEWTLSSPYRIGDLLLRPSVVVVERSWSIEGAAERPLSRAAA